MEPARTIITDLGGPTAVARICGVHRTRVSNWMRPRKVGGTGGIIPQKHHRVILNELHKLGIKKSAEDLLPLDDVGTKPKDIATPSQVAEGITP